jgi:ribonuclease Z
MECFVLGTGGMMPMPRRHLTSVAVRTGGVVYLFDCGEGTQVPYKAKHVGQRALRVVAITHLHADHCLGLPGMMMLRAQMDDPAPLVLVGPPGLGRFVGHVRGDLAIYINYPIEIHEWSPSAGERAYEDDLVRLSWRPVEHSVLCLGYRLEERERPGKFDADAADRLGVPWGPLRGELQGGRDVTLPGGRVVRAEEVVGRPRRGRRIAFVTDTAVTPAIEQLARDVDLAFIEGMFLPEHADEARDKKHLTAQQAAAAAQRAGAARLVLVHVSPRYERGDLEQMAEVAAAVHPAAEVGREGQVITLALPD